MKKVIYLIFLTFVIGQVSAQYQTNTWFTGYLEPGNTDRDSIYNIQVDDNKVNISLSNTPHSFESTFASISDSLGNLLLYTNGCMISNNNHQIIGNGDGLNPGPMSTELCGHYGYISEMGAVFIPVPNHKNDFWLIHMAIERDTLLKTKYGPLYATYIDGSSGNYVVTNKNQILLTGDLERFAVVKNGNGRDWWIMTPKYGTNEYFKFLLSPNGIEEKDFQEIGPIFHYKYCSNGRASNVFSNLGTYYARYNVSCGPVVFNFDRCTGLLIDPVSFVPDKTQFGGGGVSFNSDDSKMYYTTQNEIYKISLNENPPTNELLVPWKSTYSNTLGDMFTGPDNNIYIRAMSSSFNIHVLYPDFTTTTEDSFKIKAITLPVRNTRTLPFYANYDLGHIDNSPCDSLVVLKEIIQNRSLTIYPNPSHHILTIDLKGIEFYNNTASINIYKYNGEQVYFQDLNSSFSQFNIDILNYTPGFYYLKIKSGKNEYVGKVVIQ